MLNAAASSSSSATCSPVGPPEPRSATTGRTAPAWAEPPAPADEGVTASGADAPVAAGVGVGVTGAAGSGPRPAISRGTPATSRMWPMNRVRLAPGDPTWSAGQALQAMPVRPSGRAKVARLPLPTADESGDTGRLVVTLVQGPDGAAQVA